MNIREIPFKLGMQYENWEFDLERIEDRLVGYECYLYARKFEYGEVLLERIELIFNADILCGIIITSQENLNLSGYSKLDKYYYEGNKSTSSKICKSLSEAHRG